MAFTGFADYYFNSPNFKNEYWEFAPEEINKAKGMGFQVENIFRQQGDKYYGTPHSVSNLRKVFAGEMPAASPISTSAAAEQFNPNSTWFSNPISSPKSSINVSPSSQLSGSVSSVPSANQSSGTQVIPRQQKLSYSILKNSYR